MQEIYYADYDYATQTKSIRRGEANISESGEALIRLKGGKRLCKKAGEYLNKDEFEVYWRGCLEQKAEQMAKRIGKEEAADNA